MNGRFFVPLCFALASFLAGCSDNSTGPALNSSTGTGLHGQTLGRVHLIGSYAVNGTYRNASIRVYDSTGVELFLDTLDRFRFHGPGFDTTVCNGSATFPAPAPGDTLWAELVLRDSGLVYRSFIVVGPGDSVAYSVSIPDSLLFATWKGRNPYFSDIFDSIAFLDQTSHLLLGRRESETTIQAPDLVQDLAPDWRTLPVGSAASLMVIGQISLSDTFNTSMTRLGGQNVYWERFFSETRTIPLR